tara:strand:+ start:1492 stop:2217 length:726 start_codon:yes stop_codon:yes gene_type:complete
MLEIKNLYAESNGKEIIKNISLKLEKGKVYVLMGPNGSGKTTLANTLMGNEKYKIKKGKVLFEEKDITSLSPDERARKGIFLSFQSPPTIEGVTISKFLRAAFNSRNKETISFLDFQKLLNEKADLLGIDGKFLLRYLNDDFSGGEKKKMEILQMLVLNPKFIILDETDSGLDVSSLKNVSKKIKEFMDDEKCILIITHYKRILEYLNPERVFVMKDGEIKSQGNIEILDRIEKKGYKGIK